MAPGQEGRTEAGSDVGQCSATSFPSPSPIQLYPAGPANVSPAPAPLCGADAGSRTVTGDKLGDRWLGWSRVAHGGSLSFYIPEADALRLLARARLSMVCISALRPRANKGVRLRLGFGSFSSPIPICSLHARLFYVWSRERKSSSGSSGADAGSRTVTGDSLVCGGLGGVGGRPRGLPLLLHTGAGRRPASLDQGSAVDGVYLCSSPSGQSESD